VRDDIPWWNLAAKYVVSYVKSKRTIMKNNAHHHLKILKTMILTFHT